MFSRLFHRELLPESTSQWLFDTFAWALRNFGTDIFYEDTLLITPTDTYFPDNVGQATSTNIAETIFQRVKRYAGMDSWSCKLQPQEEKINPYLGTSSLVRDTPISPLGTFYQADEASVVISYDQHLVNHPTALIATFAHELGHYLSLTAEEEQPGGEILYEPATDVLAVFMGFGLFMVNSAFSFRQYTDTFSQGWQASENGYLSEKALTYALAIFCVLKSLDNTAVQPHLKKSLYPFFKKARQQIEADEQNLQTLRNITSKKATAKPKNT